MKFIFHITILFLFTTTITFGQDQVIDLTAKVGTDQGKFSSFHFINNESFVAAFEKQIVLMNVEGGIIEKASNPLEGKKLKYNHFVSKNNYSVKEDVFYTPDGYNKMLFIRNYSSSSRELIEIDIPVVEGLRSSKDKYNTPTSYFKNNTALEDQQVFFISKNSVIIAETYFSMSTQSHGMDLPEKGKYYTFVRLIFLDLNARTQSEEFILKDVLSVKRDKLSVIDLKLLSFENNQLQIGVLDATSKLISPAANGFSYQGNYTVFGYNVKEKDIEQLAKNEFTTEPKAVNSKLLITPEGLSITWNERVPDGFSLHNKTYHMSDNKAFDSVFYHFPQEIVKLPTPSFNPIYEYETLKKDRFCVVYLNLVENKWGKNPVPAYFFIRQNVKSLMQKRSQN